MWLYFLCFEHKKFLKIASIERGEMYLFDQSVFTCRYFKNNQFKQKNKKNPFNKIALRQSFEKFNLSFKILSKNNDFIVLKII